MAKKKPKENEFDACEVANEIAEAADKAIKTFTPDQKAEVLEEAIGNLQSRLDAVNEDISAREDMSDD